MDKHRMQEQARYLQARLSQGTVAANQLLCMHAKGEGRFAEQVLQKTRGKGAPLYACSRGGEGAQKAFSAFAYRGQAFTYRGQEDS